MHHFSVAACIIVWSGILSAAIAAIDIWRRPQPMRIMNAVWILTPLWSSVIGLAAYFTLGRAEKVCIPHPDQPQTGKRSRRISDRKIPGPAVLKAHVDLRRRTNGDTGKSQGVTASQRTNKAAETAEMSAMKGMEMNHPKRKEMSKMNEANGAGMAEMNRNESRPCWQSVVLSTLHCGAGCTLADLVGEWLLFFVPVAIGGSLLAGSWVTDYLLALLFGIGFQYAAIRGMQRIPRGEAMIRAAKADFLSLTAWQAGMYGWMAIAMFVLGDGTAAPRTSYWFWFMMQIGMCCGFVVSLPVNVWLIRKGIKEGM